MKRFLAVLTCLVSLVSFAACSSDSPNPVGPGPDPGPTDLQKYTCGRWHTSDLHHPGDGWDVVFAQNLTFVGYAANRPTPTITGTYAIAADGSASGNWTATRGTRVGRFEAHFADAGARTLYFKFIETNAFDNPEAVNGVVATENQGSNLDASCPPSSGSQADPTSNGDAIDPNTVTWATANPAAWPVTATMSDPTIYLNHPAGCTIHNPDQCATVGPCVKFNFSVPGDWPLVGGKIVASGWVMGKMNGRWYAGVWEGIAPGGSYFTTTEQCPDQSTQFIQSTGDIADHTFVSGEEIGFMISTVARGPHPASPVGRSKIVKTTYP